jgi:hypothetical protein
MDRKAPRLILSAWLLDYIYRLVFENPFVCVSNFFSAGIKRSRPRFGSDLQKFIRLVKSCEYNPNHLIFLTHLTTLVYKKDAKEVHSWRAQLLRMLNPLVDEATCSPGLMELKQSYAAAQLKYCKDTAKILVQITSPLLVDAEKEEALKQLTDILLNSCQLAFALGGHTPRR